MEKIMHYTWLAAGILLLGSACAEDTLTPQIDIASEYGYLTELTEQSSHADSVIAKWYGKYNCAVLHRFKEEDFTWLWAGKFEKPYAKFDTANQEDSASLEKMLDYIETRLFVNYSDEFLKENLPYKIFLVKELKESYITQRYVNVLSNDQDALFVGYMSSATHPYSAANFEANLSTAFAQLFFSKMSQKPTEFLASIVPVKYSLITVPQDKAIEAEQKIYPDFVDKNEMVQRNAHAANVIGYIKGANNTAKIPTQGQDYADYLSFITNNPGSYIRQRTQYYWRMAKRAALFIDFFKKMKEEDLIAKQNAKFPDDKVTSDDFNYTEK
ncbi:hypothetical protein ABLT32_02905 [Bacteroides pyogenes]|uniref:hypothetical protein n=1 Tax=Bacteroides pyogenes TaxID=310300 RepID=UPI004063FA05